MAEIILYRNIKKFADQSKKNQSKTRNNIRDIEFRKLKLFCFKNRNENTEKKQTGAIGPTGGAICSYHMLGRNLTIRTHAFI